MMSEQPASNSTRAHSKSAANVRSPIGPPYVAARPSVREMPDLITSLPSTGTVSRSPSSRASVVFPAPGTPPTMTRNGRGTAEIMPHRPVPDSRSETRRSGLRHAGRMVMPTVADAARLIRAGRLAAEELMVSCLDAIERDNPGLNAFVYLDAEHALDAARGRSMWRCAIEVASSGRSPACRSA